MNFIINSLIYFGISFILIFLIYVIFINRKRKEYTQGKNQIDINYVIQKFNLDMRKTKYKTLKWVISIVNSFIISFTFTIIVNINGKYIIKLLIGFVILFILIYSIYEIAGRILKNQEEKVK